MDGWMDGWMRDEARYVPVLRHASRSKYKRVHVTCMRHARAQSYTCIRQIDLFLSLSLSLLLSTFTCLVYRSSIDSANLAIAKALAFISKIRDFNEKERETRAVELDNSESESPSVKSRIRSIYPYREGPHDPYSHS
jgi:hypothetical protein